MGPRIRKARVSEKMCGRYEQILELASKGYTTEQIAQLMGASVYTTRGRIEILRDILVVRNLTAAVALFVRAQYEAPHISVFEWVRLGALPARSGIDHTTITLSQSTN